MSCYWKKKKEVLVLNGKEAGVVVEEQVVPLSRSGQEGKVARLPFELDATLGFPDKKFKDDCRR